MQYVIDPQGDFVSFFGKNATAADMASSVRATVGEYEKHHPDYRKGAGIAREEALAQASEDCAYEKRRKSSWLGFLWKRRQLGMAPSHA